MTYETVKIESKDADRVHILTGTITDIGDGVVDVNIDDYGVVSDIPVFYHCPESETADGMPFSTNDRVIIVNSGSAVTPVIANMKVIGFEDGLPRECLWDEEWDSTFCGNHQWEERVSYYNDWKGINGIYYCNTAPTIETTIVGGVIHHLHENIGPTQRNPDTHVISLSAADGAISGIKRVIFNFPIAQVTGTPHNAVDERYVYFRVPYRDQYDVFGLKTYYLAYAGGGSPPIYPPGVEHDELLDGGNPVTVRPSGAQFRVSTRTRRLVTAEWSCDYIRLRQ